MASMGCGSFVQQDWPQLLYIDLKNYCVLRYQKDQIVESFFLLEAANR